jgi:hypothetical protein
MRKYGDIKWRFKFLVFEKKQLKHIIPFSQIDSESCDKSNRIFRNT